MALDNLSLLYPGQANPPSADYPQGSARNVSAPDSLDGTPWEQQIINDQLGFFQALLAAGGVTPNGDPDTAQNSQYLEALQRMVGGPYERHEALMNGDFNANPLSIQRMGDAVTVASWGFTFDSSSAPSTFPGVVPLSWARPLGPYTVRSAVLSEDWGVAQFEVRADGSVGLDLRDWSGAPVNRTSVRPFAVTYLTYPRFSGLG